MVLSPVLLLIFSQPSNPPLSRNHTGTPLGVRQTAWMRGFDAPKVINPPPLCRTVRTQTASSDYGDPMTSQPIVEVGATDADNLCRCCGFFSERDIYSP